MLISMESPEPNREGPSRSPPANGALGDFEGALPPDEFAVGHRMKAVRSVLAIAIDEGCVFAGLQGGDIVVSTLLRSPSSAEWRPLTSIFPGLVSRDIQASFVC
jgi:hypothetical protein